MRKIILASASPRRTEIMRMSGFPFEVEVGDYEEDMTEKLPPKLLAEKLALGKALSVAVRHNDAIIIGADTFIVAGDEIFGKPYTAERARQMLLMLSGGTHKVLTGYALVDTHTGAQHVGVSVTEVTFRRLSDAEIDAYIKTGEPLERAGGYAIQSGGAKFVSRIDGDYLGIVGLPLCLIVEELAKLGVETES